MCETYVFLWESKRQSGLHVGLGSSEQPCRKMYHDVHFIFRPHHTNVFNNKADFRYAFVSSPQLIIACHCCQSHFFFNRAQSNVTRIQCVTCSGNCRLPLSCMLCLERTGRMRQAKQALIGQLSENISVGMGPDGTGFWVWFSELLSYN